MELHREQPPAYVSTNPDELKLPSVPQHEIGTSHPPADLTLPGLHSVLAGIPERSAIAYDRHNHPHALRADRLAEMTSQQPYSRGLPGIDSSSFAGQFRTSTESAIMSPTETGSVMSVDDTVQSSTRGGSLSLEDPDVRMAAEALSGLGNPDFARHTKQQTRSHRVPSEVIGSATEVDKDTQEPMLQLLIEAHPWVGGTINGSLSAYTTTKHYTPRIVQYGANLMERNTLNTVSTIGRFTGVESGIRRYLNSRRPSDLEKADGKRRKVAVDSGDEMDIDRNSESAIDDSPSRTRFEYLPAYRNSKPPSYREESSPADVQRQPHPHSRSWSTKVMISSSALGVALSDASRRSLTYCVELLTTATRHIETVLNALRLVLREYEQAQEERDRDRDRARFAKEVEVGLISRSQAEHEEATRRLADKIKQMCDDIWGTLKHVVHSVSTYTGGALPENARVLVRGQIMSIPRRWHLAGASVQQDEESGPSTGSEGSAAGDVTKKAAHRMIVFAQEGLDVMGQVNGVCQITLQKAEEWLNTFGRKQQQPMSSTGPADQSASLGASEAPAAEASEQGQS
ncbi:transcription factor Opi1-domain-containing protein [Elsinoe ampelina]|uniref:Transcription factor Opi1-domain-containing protein n=1 Tax=Elsinoe ampelina TaxID=302913 RepID=A0A6A6G4M8_9PEZI|nr:transcription factor Opi1-domain-containing protein [Elsinoe ampelina]